MKSKRPFRFLKWLGISVLTVVTLVALFLAAFVYNPFEGSLRDVRDVVPREVDFFVRKTGLIDDFGAGDGRLELSRSVLPEPKFWADLADAQGWRDVLSGPVATTFRTGQQRSLQQAVDAIAQLQESSSGFLDLARDALGTELVLAGYTEDRSKNPPQPLQQPWWCVYSRVTWRLRFVHGLLGWSMVQDQARAQGLEIAVEDGLLSLRSPQLAEPLFLARNLDVVMLGNNKNLLLQSLRLADGDEEEQPFGLAAQYTEGVVDPLAKWADVNRVESVNAVEFSAATSSFDAFRRFAATFPDAKNIDSMNERVLASFLNLKGWNSVSSAVMFERTGLSLLGRIVLNSNLHTPFQSSFYRAEEQDKREWLVPFLRMVPDSSCAAVALRMPAGEFLHAMYDSLVQNEREMLDDALRRCTWKGQQLADTRDLIDRLKIALLPRMGFVFRKNVPDLSKNEQGELYFPVTARSPVPQFAWVFWLREDVRDPRDGRSPADEVVDTLRKYAVPVFRFSNVYNLPVDGLPEPVWEFANSQIPGTGELATIVFRDFFVLSNSGPLIRDILRTRYNFGSMKSIVEDVQFRRIEDELPNALNGFVWLRGQRLLSVLDDYRAASEQQNVEPDPVWIMEQRSAAEDTVRRAKYPQYPSLASMPKNVLDGEFQDAVRTYLREQWAKNPGGFSAQDLPKIDQMRGFCKLVDAAYLQLKLENNYIRFQGKLVPAF
ncbi:MAG: hypothetical protein ABL997_08530 [Planctomycetota bacterium]